MNAEDLRGRVALITGGGRGLGRAFAQALSQAGLRVAVTSRSAGELAETEALIQGQGGAAMSVAGDVRDPESVRAMAAEVEQAYGPLDLLVNNAGSAGALGPIWEADPAEWWDGFEVNLRGVFLCCRAALPSMIARGRGRIVTVASGAGAMPVAYMSAYAISKAAVIRFTETLAAETRRHGVAAFSIHPGTVRTAMTESAMTSEAATRWLPWFKNLVESQAVPPDAASRLLLYLASGAADRLSGRFFQVPEDPAEVVRRASEVEQQDLYALRLRRLS